MKRLLKKKWFIIGGIAALVLLIAGIAVPVIAATGNNYAGNSYIDGPTMTRLAGILGMTATDLKSELETGKTLAAIAQEHNVAATAIQDALVAPYADQLANRVKYGYMDQTQADTLLTNARTQAAALMQMNMAEASGTNTPNGARGGCYNYMRGNGGSIGPGWGMGPSMMQGWNANGTNVAPPVPPVVPTAPLRGGMMGRW